MQNSGYFLAAFAAVWAVLFGYVLYLVNKQNKLQQELNMLKESLKEKKGNK